MSFVKKLPAVLIMSTLAFACATVNAAKVTAPMDANAYWSGVYFGTYFGAGAGKSRTSFDETGTELTQTRSGTTTTTNVQNFTESGHFNGDVTGSVADLFVGFNWHPDCAVWMLGAQVEGSIFSDVTYKSVGQETETAVSRTTTTTLTSTTTSTGSSVSTQTSSFYDDLRSMFKLVGRAGYIVDPSTMIYVLGGGAEGNFVVPASQDFTAGKRNKWVPGYTVGAGAEYMFNEHISLRAEYRYLHFNVDRSMDSASTNLQIGSQGFASSEVIDRSLHTNFSDNLGEIGIVYRI